MSTSLLDVSKMDKLTIFVFGIVAGIILLILAFGFHHSPEASPQTGAQPPKSRLATQSTQRVRHEVDKSDYV